MESDEKPDQIEGGSASPLGAVVRFFVGRMLAHRESRNREFGISEGLPVPSWTFHATSTT
jgi:hypothetical protein